MNKMCLKKLLIITNPKCSNRANKHMESKPSQFVPKVVNFLRHIFCLAVWRFSGLPITIRKRVRPLFRPLAGLMFPVCATIAKLR